MRELPSELIPTQVRRVIDLVKQAGIDVSDWSKFSGNPSSNPKYCYEWAFQESDVVVCNLWLDGIEVVKGNIEFHVELIEQRVSKRNPSVRIGRRRRMKAILAHAYAKGLPIRVIVIDGQSRTATKRAKITGRLLDPKTWNIIKFKQSTGEIILRRGDWASEFADQFSSDKPPIGDPSVSTRASKRYKRSGDIREWVLNRAKGRCEFCGRLGFELEDGRRYLETHHIIPLFQRGKDSTKNVIALCANDHRRSHVGVDKERLAEAFAVKVRKRELAL